MIVVAALGTTLGIAARPHTHVHSVDRRFVRAADGEWMAHKQVAQSLRVDPSSVQRGVEAAPATAMRRLQAQVSGGRADAVRSEDGVGKLEESVSPAAEAFVERAAEGAKSIGRFHDALIMLSLRLLRILRRQRS